MQLGLFPQRSECWRLSAHILRWGHNKATSENIRTTANWIHLLTTRRPYPCWSHAERTRSTAEGASPLFRFLPFRSPCNASPSQGRAPLLCSQPHHYRVLCNGIGVQLGGNSSTSGPMLIRERKQPACMSFLTDPSEQDVSTVLEDRRVTLRT